MPAGLDRIAPLRLEAVAAHLTPGLRPAAAGSMPRTAHDHCGNEWQVNEEGQLQILAAGTARPRILVGQPPQATAVETDDDGFVWLLAGSKLFFTNPRKIADTETPDGSPQIPGAPGVWTAVASEALPGVPTDLARGELGVLAAQCDTGEMAELRVRGKDIGGPFTSGHLSEVSVSKTVTGADQGWEILPARLPCGTHDNYCTTAGGRAFIVGGVTHHYGFPAETHAHDELLALDPSEQSWSVAGRLPTGGCCYSAIAALDDNSVWVIGGGGGGGPVRAECWIFDISSSSSEVAITAAPPLPSPRLGCIAAAAQGRIWVVGGTGGVDGFGDEPLNELISIAPGETAWRTGKSLVPRISRPDIG
jgi:hypothetical protein